MLRLSYTRIRREEGVEHHLSRYQGEKKRQKFPITCKKGKTKNNSLVTFGRILGTTTNYVSAYIDSCLYRLEERTLPKPSVFGRF